MRLVSFYPGFIAPFPRPFRRRGFYRLLAAAAALGCIHPACILYSKRLICHGWRAMPMPRYRLNFPPFQRVVVRPYSMSIPIIERLGAKRYSLANIEAMCQDVEAFLQILWMQESFLFFHMYTDDEISSLYE
jgi:hypothetical protein